MSCCISSSKAFQYPAEEATGRMRRHVRSRPRANCWEHSHAGDADESPLPEACHRTGYQVGFPLHFIVVVVFVWSSHAQRMGIPHKTGDCALRLRWRKTVGSTTEKSWGRDVITHPTSFFHQSIATRVATSMRHARGVSFPRNTKDVWSRCDDTKSWVKLTKLQNVMIFCGKSKFWK